jgi:hypothetical protein
MLFLNSWRVSSHIVRYDTDHLAIQKQQWDSREAQIEPPLIECDCEWAFRIRALEYMYNCIVNDHVFVAVVFAKLTKVSDGGDNVTL